MVWGKDEGKKELISMEGRGKERGCRSLMENAKPLPSPLGSLFIPPLKIVSLSLSLPPLSLSFLKGWCRTKVRLLLIKMFILRLNCLCDPDTFDLGLGGENTP